MNVFGGKYYKKLSLEFISIIYIHIISVLIIIISLLLIKFVKKNLKVEFMHIQHQIIIGDAFFRHHVEYDE